MSKNNIMNTYSRVDVTFEKGLGSKVYDINGKEYIDFVSGVAVNCLGHSHPAIIKALNDQSNNLIHISNLYWNNKQLNLAKKLCDYSDHDKVFFCNSGTEAVETAIKLARKYGINNGTSKKNEIIFMENSFHGRTMGALAITGQEKYQKDFMPLMSGVKSSKFNDIDSLKNKIDENTCAVIIEPIQGEGGIISVQIDFLKEVKNLCEKYNALLIFDEIQCGIGRTGSLFAYKKFEVIPDVICMAKGLGGGFPIGAVLATQKSADAFVPGDHGSTFGGNPLGCSVSLAVLNELIDNGVLDKVDEKSEYITNKLSKLKEKYQAVDKIQGMGLMLGIKLNIDKSKLISKCFEKGLLLVGAGENVVRILPPLNVSKEDIDKFLDILDEALNELCN
ncbi:aspartate aminotransferase family protein [Tepidibacter aestuarii]|uniref:aspartate aminotransferase family protein n=1 Tax=Tepidibacter aestuarii TaxID=2925782 RepID=UPI0020BE98A0|nr:aspartate aminotransferase family protein [Tepidibacter aestuarii]CAH2213332.1 N-acetylornithine aminotransferase (PLP-dependent) [Tepidibacter aestuarii]